MSTRYNTGNPIESSDVRDMSDNAKNLDLFSLSNNDSFSDRLGVSRKTLSGAVKDIGIPIIGNFTTGCTVTTVNQGVQEIGGSVYRWKGELPKIVPPSSAPSGTGGISPAGDWVDVGDASAYARVLSELAATGGVNLVNGAAKQSDLTAIDFRVDYLEDIQGDTNKTAAQIARKLAAGSNTSISCFGDSTMWGATVGALGTQDPNNAPSKLQLALSLIYGLTVPVNNRAISGTTLRQMMAGTDGSGSTFKSKISAGGVDVATEIIYCNHGINDSQLDGDIDQYRADLVEFVRLCRVAGKVPILVTPNPNPPILLITEVKSKRLLNFIKVMRDVASKMAVDLIDQYKYMTASFRCYKPEEIVPDGAHLASFAYRQAGFNLAIPMVSCQIVAKDGDFSTLTNTSYFDNLSSSRQIQTQPLRCGQVLTANRPVSGNEGFNYPVILGEARKVISFVGLQWNSAANCIAFDNGESLGTYYQTKQFGNQSALDWDSDCKFYGRRMAGLHVFGALFDMSAPGLGNGMTFGGISLPEISAQSTTGAIASPDPYTKSVGDSGDTIITRTVVGSGGVYFTDKSGSPVIVARLNGGIFTVDLYKNGVVVQTGTAGSGLTQQVYGLAIQIGQTSVTVTLDSLTVTIATTTKLPNIKPYTSLMPYNIVPTAGV